MAYVLDISNVFGSFGTHSHLSDSSSLANFVSCLPFQFTSPLTSSLPRAAQFFSSPIPHGNLSQLMYDRNVPTYPNDHLYHRRNGDTPAETELPFSVT